MARSRNIKPGFFSNEDLVELPFSTRILFSALWCLADREGRLEDRPKKIKMFAFPADNVDVDEALQELHDRALIVRYEVDGKLYLAIPAFYKHQKPHSKEAASTIPPPSAPKTTTKVGAHTDQGHIEHATSTDLGNCEHALIPDSLNLIPDSSEIEPHGSCVEQEKSCLTPPATDVIPFTELPLEPLPEEGPVISLPCTGGKNHGVTQADIDHYAELYPGLDILQQLRNMVGWLEANPKKRKTYGKGVKSFITGWLTREQNKGGVYRAGTGPPGQSPPQTGHIYDNWLDRSG